MKREGGRGQIDPPFQKKLPSKSSAFLGLKTSILQPLAQVLLRFLVNVNVDVYIDVIHSVVKKV